MDVLYTLLSDIAEREGLDPVDLDPPLYEEVDAEAFEAITADLDRPRDDPAVPVEFSCYGYTVDIDESGTVTISDQSGATDVVTREPPEPSPGTPGTRIDDRDRALVAVADIVAARDRPLDRRLDGLLEVARETLDLNSATLSYVNRDNYVFEAVDGAATLDLRAGDTVPLAETVCRRVVETERALVLRDIEAEAPELANTAFEVSAYIGVPVFVDGDVYGTFCFYDREARAEEFSEWDLAFVELLGKWVSGELEQRRLERSLQARTFERASNGS